MRSQRSLILNTYYLLPITYYFTLITILATIAVKPPVVIPEEKILRIASGACFNTSGISSTPKPKDRLTAKTRVSLRPISCEETMRIHKKRLAQAEKRLGELDRLFIRIYEDNVAGRITDEKFSMMSKTYEDEQAQLKEEIQTLQQEIEVQERQIENLEQFIQRVRKYEDLDELTPYALRELVKAIYIEAPDKSSGKRYQGIRISYDLVGFIPVEELLKQETA